MKHLIFGLAASAVLLSTVYHLAAVAPPIRVGMTYDEVIKICGEPSHTNGPLPTMIYADRVDKVTSGYHYTNYFTVYYGPIPTNFKDGVELGFSKDRILRSIEIEPEYKGRCKAAVDTE